MALTRGAVITAVLPSEFGKPRPVIVLRANRFMEHRLVTVVPITSAQQDAPLLRLDLGSSAENGLHLPSQAMADAVQSIPVTRVGQMIGQLSLAETQMIER